MPQPESRNCCPRPFIQSCQTPLRPILNSGSISRPRSQLSRRKRQHCDPLHHRPVFLARFKSLRAVTGFTDKGARMRTLATRGFVSLRPEVGGSGLSKLAQSGVGGPSIVDKSMDSGAVDRTNIRLPVDYYVTLAGSLASEIPAHKLRQSKNLLVSCLRISRLPGKSL